MIASGAAEGLRISVELGMNWANRFLTWTVSRTPSHDSASCYVSSKMPPREDFLMLTPAQQHAVDRFAKSLPALGDDALIDTYHQAWEDHREARAECSDNLRQCLREESCDRKGDAGSLP